MKKKSLVLILGSLVVLASCGNNDNSSESSKQSNESSSQLESSELRESSSESVSSSNSEKHESSDSVSSSEQAHVDPEHAKFTLHMEGALRLNQSRSIYAIFKDSKTTGTVKFYTSDKSIITCSEITGVSNEAYLSAKAEGTATIYAYLEGEEDILVSEEITIAHGTALAEDTFNKLTGAMKVNFTQELFDYDAKTLEKSLYGAYDIATIYEETSDDPDYPYHNTDAYQIDVVERNGKGNNDFHKKYVRSGTRLAVEYLTSKNTVGQVTQYNDEGEEYHWVNSYYENLFKYDEESDTSALVTAADFESFDGGKTYEYVGNAIWATTYLTVSFVLEDITPDSFAITVADDGTLGFEIVTDPYGKDTAGVKGGQLLKGTVSEIGTAKIDHLQPYTHETYHDALETARAELANAKNYTASYKVIDSDSEFGTTNYTITYTEDTIEQKIVDKDGKILSNNGVHKNGTGYFTYTVDENGVVTKTKDYEAAFDSVNRYPTFDFAIEILGETPTDLKYASRGAYVGDFFSACWELPKYCAYYTAKEGAEVTLTNDGHLAGMNATLASSSLADEIEFQGTYTNIGTTAINRDWDSAVTPDTPTTYPAKLLASLKEWGVDEVIPFLYPENVGYCDEVVVRAKNKSNESLARYGTFKTNEFETEAKRDDYITKYKALLVEKGWTLTTEIDENLNYAYYVDPTGNWKLSVGAYANYYGGALLKRVCFTFNNKDGNMVTPDSYNL